MCASRIRLELVRPGPGSGGADGQMARQSTAQLEQKEQKGRRFCVRARQRAARGATMKNDDRGRLLSAAATKTAMKNAASQPASSPASQSKRQAKQSKGKEERESANSRTVESSRQRQQQQRRRRRSLTTTGSRGDEERRRAGVERSAAKCRYKYTHYHYMDDADRQRQ
ncbi:hypothetical protein TYRP_008314 [Tyrophagus putrescentiae]|nr:hypothetical protein TYRP_008314 [Tyrophagus putrescentiae]